MDRGSWQATVHGVTKSWTQLAAFGEGNGTPLQYSCLENPMDGGAWWAAVHGVAKSRTRLSDFTFTFHFHALEKEMATHSSVLAWRIPGMAEPSGLPSMGSHRVGHDWSDLAAVAAAADDWASVRGTAKFTAPSASYQGSWLTPYRPVIESPFPEGNGNPVLYSYLGNPMDREVWQAMVHGVTKSQTRLSN